MTDQTPEQTTDAGEETSTEVQTPQEPTEAHAGNAEAAKWRTRLREAEAERDTLAQRLQRLQRAEVTRLATGPGKLHDGSDLATDLADLVDDEGDVDPAKVSAAVAALVEQKPHLGAPAYGDVGQGEHEATTGATWADVIHG